MKKILIIDASLRKGFSNETAIQVKSETDKKCETELIVLRDFNITRCKGCCACLSIGSASCPLRNDDVKIILDKMQWADGVIYVTPNYALSVPGILKDLFDRLSYVFHRPRLFGKTCLPVIVQGVYGGGKVSKYINEVMSFWGMKTVKGVVLSGGIYPKKGLKEEIKTKNGKALDNAINRFYKSLYNEKPAKPTLFWLMIFRMTRTSMKYFEEALEPDKKYFEKNGWFTSDYYYKVKINPIKKLIGKFFDNMIKRMAKKQ